MSVTKSPRDLMMEVVNEVAARHRVTAAGIFGESRSRSVCAARHEAIYRVFMQFGWGVTKVGRAFGRDHTTVIHSLNRYARINPASATIWRDKVALMDMRRDDALGATTEAQS